MGFLNPMSSVPLNIWSHGIYSNTCTSNGTDTGNRSASLLGKGPLNLFNTKSQTVNGTNCHGADQNSKDTKHTSQGDSNSVDHGLIQGKTEQKNSNSGSQQNQNNGMNMKPSGDKKEGATVLADNSVKGSNNGGVSGILSSNVSSNVDGGSSSISPLGIACICIAGIAVLIIAILASIMIYVQQRRKAYHKFNTTIEAGSGMPPAPPIRTEYIMTT
jgi:hypothetical protein